MLLPYGFGPERPHNYADMARVASLGAEGVRGAGGPVFRVGHTFGLLYAVSGSSQDWARHEAGIRYALTIELRDTGRQGFLLPASLIEQSGAEMLAGLEAMLRAVL